MKNICQKIGLILYQGIGGRKMAKKVKESREARKARIELSGCLRTQTVPNKKAYSRKPKHKGYYD